jgi:hypothetical protein
MADPHTWAIPRLSGASKAALVEIQADEYGGGRVEQMHSELFRATMRGLDLNDSYGAYLEWVPAITLAISNTMSLFGLHRRHLGALLGHLAAFEMTSSAPNYRYSLGLRRLGGMRRRGVSTTSTCRPTPFTSRSPRTTCAAASWHSTLRGPVTSCTARPAPWPWTGSSPSTSWIAGAAVSPRCARRT